jgi:predicted nicotinamide N-methyase
MAGERDTGEVVADEGDWYAALVAGENVGEWLETVENVVRSSGRRERASRSLATKVRGDRVYADEATEAGAKCRLEAAIAALDLAGDETHATQTLREALEQARSACLEAADLVATTVTKKIGTHTITIRELALGRGVGAKLWRAAGMLADNLAVNAMWCDKKNVLELGSGVGLCGLLVAKLGAESVALSDFEFPLLDSLVLAAKANHDTAEGEKDPPILPTVVRCDWREEAAGEVLMAGGLEIDGRVERETRKTDSDAFKKENPFVENEPTKSLDVDAAAVKGGWVSRLHPHRKFDRIIGSDLVYERTHAETLPWVLQRRLQKNGEARIFGAVRDRALLDETIQKCEDLGLAVLETKLGGNRGDDWYEDGYAGLDITWQK